MISDCFEQCRLRIISPKKPVILSLSLTSSPLKARGKPRGDIIAYVARESPVSEIEGVLNTVGNHGRF